MDKHYVQESTSSYSVNAGFKDGWKMSAAVECGDECDLLSTWHLTLSSSSCSGDRWTFNGQPGWFCLFQTEFCCKTQPLPVLRWLRECKRFTHTHTLHPRTHTRLSLFMQYVVQVPSVHGLTEGSRSLFIQTRARGDSAAHPLTFGWAHMRKVPRSLQLKVSQISVVLPLEKNNRDKKPSRPHLSF